MPSLSGLFYICEYLGISLSDFFDLDNENPNKVQEIMHDIKQLNDSQLAAVSAIIKEIIKV